MSSEDRKERKFIVEVASSRKDLEEAKVLDDKAFGAHHGITLVELEEIVEVGKLILLRDAITGELVGESQLIFKPVRELPYSFAHPVAFCYGTAIKPQFQGYGLGRILALEQEKEAKASKKTELQLTVRVENYPSLRMRTKLGYEVYAYSRDFYGPNPDNDARLFLRKRLSEEISLKEVKVAVTVIFGDKHDAVAHRHIQEMLSMGYYGVAVDRENGILFG